ncbi:hypothetical protein FACS1894208_08640 [Clostridia bacterium]|nr:hypothetical protein FACS1894208_08640 [Clostridia bacterium]
MLLPSKITTFQSSILSKLPVALNFIQQGNKGAVALFSEIKPHVRDIVEYIEVLYCLYALGKIDFNEETRGREYVG